MIAKPEKEGPGCHCLLERHDTPAGCREFGKRMAPLFVAIGRDMPRTFARLGDESERAAHLNEVHVLPVRDHIEHHTGGDCPCGPIDEPVKREDGSVGWVFTHHSLDGREGRE